MQVLNLLLDLTEQYQDDLRTIAARVNYLNTVICPDKYAEIEAEIMCFIDTRTQYYADLGLNFDLRTAAKLLGFLRLYFQ